MGSCACASPDRLRSRVGRGSLVPPLTVALVRVLVVVVAVVLLAAACGGRGTDAGAPGLDQVAVDGGRVSGRSQDGLHVFLGVPYAAPPVKDLRWRPPAAVVPWEGVRSCTAYGPSCPQPAPWESGPLSVGATSEDCLYLNVWTPARNAAERLPVMVWFHGGGFTSGSASESIFDGAGLAHRGVVVVSVNYRLGPFGFLAHPALSRESADGVSGNYGLLDQIAALEWVRRNIAAFGGDRERVTAFGESAGGMSVCYLMTSPAARGLFRRAIVESAPFDGGASGFGAVRMLPAAEKLGREFARSLGIDGAADVAARLRAVPEGRLVAKAAVVGMDETRGSTFAPIVDGKVLPEVPAAVFARAGQAPVPMIVGANADEANMFITRGTSVAAIDRLMRLAYGPAVDDARALFPARRYGGEMPALSRMATVLGFWAPARFAAEAALRAGAPSYLYLFTRVPDLPLTGRLGAIHGMELPYVFGNEVLTLDLDSGVDGRVSDAMMACWTRFAATGDPNGEGVPRWTAYDPVKRRYLEFGDEIAARSHLYDEACDLADSLRGERLQGTE
jgi:para-nitrobenzyl esterase